MMSEQPIEMFDKHVRQHIYEHFVKIGQAPTIAQSAQTLSSTISEVQVAYRRLAHGRALVLQGNGEILMAESFSLI
jgi:hypothetical protein